MPGNGGYRTAPTRVLSSFGHISQTIAMTNLFHLLEIQVLNIKTTTIILDPKFQEFRPFQKQAHMYMLGIGMLGNISQGFLNYT